MYYKNIAEQVKAEYAGYMESHAAAIMEGSADRVKSYSTDTRARQYDAGKISLDELKQIAVERNTRKYNKEMQSELEKLDRIGNAGTVESITIRVDWKRSSVWGYNPTARVDIYGSNGWNHATDSASGCGYDKRSAAVGGALSSMPEMLKILCDMKEKYMDEHPDTEYKKPGSNEKYIEYGAGYGAIPYFEGGVGFSCFARILKKAGFKPVVMDEGGKYSDYYYFVKEAC